MSSEAPERSVPIERCEELLKAASVRVTHQRLEVLREVLNSRAHPDAEAVFRGVRNRLPTVSLDTIYRTLWLLTDLGLITTLGLPRERYRFDGNIRPHHHFVCLRCDLTGDFSSDELDRLPVAGAVSEFGVVARTQVEVRGVCHKCLQGDYPARLTQQEAETGS